MFCRKITANSIKDLSGDNERIFLETGGWKTRLSGRELKFSEDERFEYEETSEPQVLIVHTHATESYMDEDLGFYYESFYPRDSDDNFNVIRVGDEITRKLQQSGVGVVHCTEHHDEPQYLGAYDNSANSIIYYMYPPRQHYHGRQRKN